MNTKDKTRCQEEPKANNKDQKAIPKRALWRPKAPQAKPTRHQMDSKESEIGFRTPIRPNSSPKSPQSHPKTIKQTRSRLQTPDHRPGKIFSHSFTLVMSSYYL